MAFFGPLRIGSLELRSNLTLAPLAGYTSLAFRLVARERGPVGLATTEVVSAKALAAGARRTLELLRSAPGDRPLALQINATDAAEAREAAAIAAGRGFAAVDLNLGCPVRKVARKGGGAALARSAGEAAAVARAVVAAVSIPVTAKMRLGWAEGDLTAPEVARALEAAGVAAVSVHGRTRAQSFGGRVDLRGIAAVVRAVSIPVIGNGDIATADDARAMFEATGCAGIAIGRAAVVNPFIFREIEALLARGERLPPASTGERLAALARHFDLLVEQEGEPLACLRFRKVLRLFGRAFGAGPAFDAAAIAVASREEVARVLAGARAVLPERTAVRDPRAVPVPSVAVDLW